MKQAQATNDVKPTESLLYQLLETELGTVKVYEKALGCIEEPALRDEFTGYLAETKDHVKFARRILEVMGFDADEDHPSRASCRQLTGALLQVMEQAIATGDLRHAQLTACGCVVEAETRDHLGWELAGELANHMNGNGGRLLREGHLKVEEQEDRHLYQSRGWARELWMQALGLAEPLERRARAANAAS